MSADVDVTVELDPAEAHAFVDAMEQAGFQLRVRDLEEFVRRTRVLPFLHLATGRRHTTPFPKPQGVPPEIVRDV